MTEKDHTLDGILPSIGEWGKYQMTIMVFVGFGVVLHSAVHTAYVFTALEVSHRLDELDNILVQIGELGKYQLRFILICIAVALNAAALNSFLFTAYNVDHRCAIPECDASPADYQPVWLPNAVPFKGDRPAKCLSFLHNITYDQNDTCSYKDFDRSRTLRCSSFVYKTEDISILQEYNLQCDENLWKLAMVGTINSVGQFFGLFIGGIISDRYGRKVVLIWGMILCAVCGIARTFMPTYEWFLVFEFLDAAFGSGTYICGFVLGVELVGPKKRVLTGILSSSCYTVGEIFTAGTAWAVKSWKPLIYILYSPIFLLISYIWLVPESIRWNLSKGRIEEAKATLRKAAKVNGKELSENTLEKLTMVDVNDRKNDTISFGAVLLKSNTLSLRLVNCCFCWITCTFLFYGLTLNSVSLAAGNSYLDFILTSLIEVPAYICCNFMLQLFGRRWSVTSSYLLTGAACLAFIFVPTDYRIASLSVYLIGKFGATAAFTNVYVITSEMFPTTMRHSFMGTCSTFGRIGSMIAPQTPLLAQLWNPLPLVSFSAMAFIAGLLTLLFPETTDIKLPDTVEEAENICKMSKQLPKK